MRFSKFLLAVNFVLTGFFMSSAANAELIEGIAGYSTEPSPAVLWSFNPITDNILIGNAEIDIATNDLAGLVSLPLGPVSFNYGIGFAPVELWSAGDFRFVLEEVSVLFENNLILALTGNGTLYSTNDNLEFDPTRAEWIFTGNWLTFSAATESLGEPSVVPVPAAMWLFLSGIIGLGLSRKKLAA